MSPTDHPRAPWETGGDAGNLCGSGRLSERPRGRERRLWKKGRRPARRREKETPRRLPLSPCPRAACFCFAKSDLSHLSYFLCCCIKAM